MKEVLKQALDALEDMAEFSSSRLEKQITDLRQAIEEAEKQEPCDMGDLCIGCSPRNADGSCPDTQKQEPVVWMYQDKSTHAVKFQKHMSDFVDHSRFYETPLYTTPPQRQPLWIDPNDKTQKQYLPHIGEPVLFCHDGKTYCGHHNGGSFQNKDGYFNTWECRWMYLPAAHGITGEKK